MSHEGDSKNSCNSTGNESIKMVLSALIKKIYNIYSDFCSEKLSPVWKNFRFCLRLYPQYLIYCVDIMMTIHLLTGNTLVTAIFLK